MVYALSCLGQQDIVLKEKQSEAIKSIYEGKDVFTWLPTGYRKSRYQLLLFLFEGHGVCAAILSGLTGVSKALLATERDIAQGRLRFLFTAPGAIVGNSRWKQILLELSLRERLHHCQIFYGVYVLYGKNGVFCACARSSPQAFPPSLERPGNEAIRNLDPRHVASHPKL